MTEHWNDVYATRGAEERSWSEDEPTSSLELLDLLGVTARDSLLDVGAGESGLVDHLLARGFTDLTIMDLSEVALAATREREGHDHVATVQADVTTWRTARRFDVWHDRAVLHFLSPDDARRYVATMENTLSPRGAVVIGVFAPDGPASCSGLAVQRYSAEDLVELLGPGFTLVGQHQRRHRTPWGAEQSFQWVALRRAS